MKRIIYLLLICSIFSSIASAQTVYITKSGSKYHSDGCSYLKKSSTPIDIKEVVSKGYTPCSRCKPDSKLNANVKTENKTESKTEVKKQSTTTSNQCEAITKKGTRCKRKAQSGSRFCWQHQK
jgi:hypothetical protein